ncbi:YidC/Oxa1 family membrane protein insertase [Patescibacteria group bacterium]|nr:YidC/Oxa1 family membrane protein insertase [Patescibacteria group bacterium]MBU1682823.1 YidC/Oxa1 family membrane protein insertase [Patescibacteria group bacterium]MBU1934775.1 YidC/Oxa1 family membrane protein insertase [Patescibacteria group bacterium]
MNKLLRPLLFVLIFLMIFQFFSGKKQQEGIKDDVVLTAKSKIAIGKEVSLKIENNSESIITIPVSCPKNPLTVERYVNGEWILKETEIDPQLCTQIELIEIAPKEDYTVGYGQWSWSLFDEEGRYRISLNTNIEEAEKTYTHEFNIVPPSLLKIFWTEAFYRPIFNTLVFLISILPDSNLGWGIILLTLIIKLILLGPNHKALRAQRQMQKVQPQLDALKIKYKDDSQRLAKETMELWKKYKVSPMSSCLPILIQFPILIALFYVVRDGLDTISPELLYGTLKTFNLQGVNPNFLGIIDLTKINIIVLPIIVGGLQFIQMKLTLAKTKTNKPVKKGEINPMPMMSNMMQYFMPIMIAVFTASLPAAVGFYWGTSTLFGIGQQVVVNRSKD